MYADEIQEAQKMQETIERVLAPEILAEDEKSHPRSLILPPGKLIKLAGCCI